MSKTSVQGKNKLKNRINISPTKYLKPTVAVQKVKIRNDNDWKGYIPIEQKLPFIRQKR